MEKYPQALSRTLSPQILRLKNLHFLKRCFLVSVFYSTCVSWHPSRSSPPLEYETFTCLPNYLGYNNNFLKKERGKEGEEFYLMSLV